MYDQAHEELQSQYENSDREAREQEKYEGTKGDYTEEDAREDEIHANYLTDAKMGL